LTKEAIILAGGFGTRLREVVPDVPKCMAPIGGRPFLFYVINYLRSEGVGKFIFSLGYKHEIITDYLKIEFSTLDFECLIEAVPLGTGGAIKSACEKVMGKMVLVSNGDTLFKVNISQLSAFHLKHKADCTLSLKPMNNFERYGVVELNKDFSIKSFKEKKFYKTGLINGGVYALNTSKFLEEDLPAKFSFEKEYLEKLYPKRKMYGFIQDEYFIDIGIPADYERAVEELKKDSLDLKKIDRSWTLFLDRDGVINNEKEMDYILNWNEFSFFNGTTEAIKKFSEKFGTIIIITNQRGVGKGLMGENDLFDIHDRMLYEITNAGGRIDKIYYCTDINDNHPNRKPNPGMAYQAKADFPAIDFSKSIIAGNRLSDMKFGRNTGMFTVYISSTHPQEGKSHPDIDLTFASLLEMSRAL
jgi:D-glycero-alpha-D-manno-heptose 1-phosphate guanylyltransferase